LPGVALQGFLESDLQGLIERQRAGDRHFTLARSLAL
jgi:hypothetical protein